MLPPMPQEVPADQEATRTVCLVKNKQPLVRRPPSGPQGPPQFLRSSGPPSGLQGPPQVLRAPLILIMLT